MRSSALLMSLLLPVSALFTACSPGNRDLLPEGLVPVSGGMVDLGSAAAPGPGRPRTVTLPPFAIGRYEVTVSEFCRFLHAGEGDLSAERPQIHHRDGRYRPKTGEEDKAVTHVDHDEAEAYCRWLSREVGLACRLPTSDEWECAARPGVAGAPYPWGWGHPRGRAAFDSEGPLRVGLFAANTRGLYDMAGGVAEWCGAGSDASGERMARGGSWAERDPAQLTVYGGLRLPRGYRDADVGFRIAADLKGDGVAPAQARR